MKKVIAYVRLFRIPGIGGLAIPPVIGAISVGVFDIYKLILLFIIGALASLYGFILNDFADIEVDKLSKELQGKPLVSGNISSKSALLVCVFFILITFLLTAVLYYDQTIDVYKIGAVLCLVGAGILGSIYDFFGKKFAGSDILVAIAMAFVFLFGALSFGRPTVITWVIFVLTFNNLLHMNAIEGGIKDSDHDYILGVKNIALNSGVKVVDDKITIPNTFKALSLGIRSFTAVLLFVPFIFYGYEYYIWQIIIMIIAIFGVFFLTIRLISIRKFDRNKIRKFIAGQSFLRYSLVPIMLISIIGLNYSIILIIFPIVWYILFAPLLGEKLFRPRM